MHARARDAWSPGPICEILMFHSICLLSSAISVSSGWFSEARMAVERKLPAVPETILKRRKRQAENRALRAKEAVKSKVKLLKNGKLQNIS